MPDRADQPTAADRIASRFPSLGERVRGYNEGTMPVHKEETMGGLSAGSGEQMPMSKAPRFSEMGGEHFDSQEALMKEVNRRSAMQHRMGV